MLCAIPPSILIADQLIEPAKHEHVILETVFDYLVIGTGPSALSAARALPRAASKAVIDFGVSTPDSVKKAIESFNAGIDHQLIYTMSSKILRNSTFNPFSFRKKLYWGSAFVYSNYPTESKSLKSSQTFGGFSLVWGCTAAKPDTQFLETLPLVILSDFENSVTNVSQIFEFHESNSTLVQPRLLPTSDFSLNFLRRTQSGLRLQIEPSRIALNLFKDWNVSQCLECQLCQVGCPVNITWTSQPEFKRLMMSDSPVVLIPGEAVSFSESQNSVTVSVQEPTGNIIEVSGHRLILSGGPLSTAKLLLSSQVVPEVTIRDSQTAAVIGFTFWRNNPSTVKHSLAEVFLKANFKRFSIALQLYGYAQWIESKFRNGSFLTRAFTYVSSVFTNRFFVGLMYFPEELSGRIKLMENEFRIGRSLASLVRIFFYHVILFLRLLKNGVLINPIPLLFPVGGGNHIGSSFPNNFLPESDSASSDTFGRTFGMNRVHIVDSSSLHRLPVGSVTLTSMAFTDLICRRIGKDLDNF